MLTMLQMKKTLLLMPLLLAGCASVTTTENKINNVDTFKLVFPKDDCNFFDLKYDDSPVRHASYDQKDYVNIDKQTKQIKIGILKGAYTQGRNILYSSSTYTIPYEVDNQSDKCVIMTTKPYTHAVRYEDPTAKVLAPAENISPEDVSEFLKDRSYANIEFEEESQYSAKSTFNNFSDYGIRKDDYASDATIDRYIGYGTINYNGKQYPYTVRVSPYKNGSIVKVKISVKGDVKGNSIDFIKPINEIETKLTKIVKS